MAFYPQEKIDEVNEAADLVELVSHYVSLKRAGAVYKGLCPFHSEKTPSFIVTPHRRMFHCFGCGVGGGAITFFMKIAGHSFPEAVAELARRYGVDLPEPEAGASPQAQSRTNRAAILEVLDKAREFSEKLLWSEEGGPARRYLAARGLNQRTARDFGLGLSLDAWDSLVKHLSAKGFGEQIMLEAGLVKPGRQEGRYYDAFRNRVMVPIFNAEGRVCGFGGRLLGEAENQPKYLNSLETPVYNKGRLLYGLHRARPFLRAAGMVFLVEGYFDLISLAAAGINEVVATLGTALTPGHLNLLKGHVREVLLLFDADEAGQRAASRALPLLLNAELDGRVLTLPQGHDPDTFIREFGPEALYEAASQAKDVVEFQVARMKAAHPASLTGQARLAREARELLSQVPDSAKSQLLRRRLARLLELDEEVLGRFKQEDERRKTLTHSPSRQPAKEADYDSLAGALLKLILIHPEAAPPVLEEMGAFWPNDATRQLFDRLKECFELRGAVLPEAIAIDDCEPMAALAAEAAVAERAYRADESAAVAGDYMERLKRKWRQRRKTELSVDIKKAQAAGDEAGLARLISEKNDLLLQ
ncbi:MAG: DNA primase [Candidatus Adiutrix sp.]|jgi:DNA primase|nr:DNA primase [Candidatus Adiutrix sp.]